MRTNDDIIIDVPRLIAEIVTATARGRSVPLIRVDAPLAFSPAAASDYLRMVEHWTARGAAHLDGSPRGSRPSEIRLCSPSTCGPVSQHPVRNAEQSEPAAHRVRTGPCGGVRDGVNVRGFDLTKVLGRRSPCQYSFGGAMPAMALNGTFACRIAKGRPSFWLL